MNDKTLIEYPDVFAELKEKNKELKLTCQVGKWLIVVLIILEILQTAWVFSALHASAC